jgi:hypothetical protein
MPRGRYGLEYKKSNTNYMIINGWDEDNFEMSRSDIKVRFIKFVEKIHSGDKVEFKEAWIITTDKFTSVKILWKMGH